VVCFFSFSTLSFCSLVVGREEEERERREREREREGEREERKGGREERATRGRKGREGGGEGEGKGEEERGQREDDRLDSTQRSSLPIQQRKSSKSAAESKDEQIPARSCKCTPEKERVSEQAAKTNRRGLQARTATRKGRADEKGKYAATGRRREIASGRHQY